MSKSFSIAIHSQDDYKAVAADLVALGYKESPYIHSGDGWQYTDTVVTYEEDRGFFWPSSFTIVGIPYESVEELVKSQSK